MGVSKYRKEGVQPQDSRTLILLPRRSPTPPSMSDRPSIPFGPPYPRSVRVSILTRNGRHAYLVRMCYEPSGTPVSSHRLGLEVTLRSVHIEYSWYVSKTRHRVRICFPYMRMPISRVEHPRQLRKV